MCLGGFGRCRYGAIPHYDNANGVGKQFKHPNTEHEHVVGFLEVRRDTLLTNTQSTNVYVCECGFNHVVQSTCCMFVPLMTH